MGRTIAPYSIQMEMVEHRFSKFRRALRKQDQELADDLFRYAKFHVQAGVMAANPNPADSMLFAMLLEQQRKIRELESQVKALMPVEQSGSENGNPGLSV